jgi:transposase-like protein
MKIRRKHSNEFKFKVALEALKKEDAPSVARQYGIAYNLVNRWTKQLLNQGHLAFGMDNNGEKEVMKKKIGKLEQMIGKKEVELNLLKNFSDFYQSENGSS